MYGYSYYIHYILYNIYIYYTLYSIEVAIHISSKVEVTLPISSKVEVAIPTSSKVEVDIPIFYLVYSICCILSPLVARSYPSLRSPLA